MRAASGIFEAVCICSESDFQPAEQVTALGGHAAIARVAGWFESITT
jgi:hypothetical protein